jgi:hypothetical protein
MSEHDYVKQLLEIKELMIREKIVGSEEFVGCTDDEIADIERFAGGKLPASFRAFLQVMGKEGNWYTATVQYVWTQLKTNRKWADEIIKENESDYQVPPNAFVFSCLNGYFSFFMLNEGDDPPVYYFGEGSKEPALEKEKSLMAILWMTARYMIESRNWRMKVDRENLASLK